MSMNDLSRTRAGHFLTNAIYAYRISEAPHLLRLVLPIAGVALTNMAMSITDTLMAATFGTEALAAVAVGSDFYSVFFFLILGLVTGISPAYAAACATGDHEKLALLRTVGWIVALGVTCMVIPAVWFAPAYLSHIGIDAAILNTGSGYTRAMALTLFPMCGVCILRNRLTAIEKPGAILRVTMSAIPLNAALNYLFMYGLFDWSGMGIAGAGVASFVTATYIAVALARAAHINGDYGLAYQIDWAQAREMVRVGMPISITILSEVGVYLGSTLFVARFGVEVTAAHALTLRIAGVVYAISAGLSQACTVRMARNAAVGCRNRCRTTIRSAFGLALVSGTILLLGITLTASAALTVLPLLGLSDEVAATAVSLLLILAVTELVEPISCSATGLLRGQKDTKVPMYFAVIGNWGVGVPASLFLALTVGLGAVGVWTGLLLGLTTTAILTVQRLRMHC